MKKYLSQLSFLVQEELEIEIQRYQTNVPGKIIGLAIYFILFFTVPLALQVIMPFLLKFMSVQIMYTVVFSGSQIGVGILFNLFMWYIYRHKIPFFEQYRVDPNRPWPWEKNMKQWKMMLRKTLFLDFVNAATYVPVFLYLEAKEQIPYVLDLNLMPSLSVVINSILVMLVLDDFFSFLTHRIFHIGPLYTYFHKLHHEYNTTVSIASLHTHIVQALIAGGLPTKIYLMVTAYLFGPIHFSTVIIWNILRLYEGYASHSGYMFSWNPSQILPFCGNDGYHDFHHSHNSGNYAAQLRIWDVIFGYSRDFKEFKKKLAAKQNKQD